VFDEDGAGIRDALVLAVWDLPADQEQTSWSGLARFRAPDHGAGTYILNVLDVTKSGYTFEIENSVLSASVTR